MNAAEPEYVTIKTACELLGVSPNTLRSWGATGKVKEYRHPLNNYRLYRQRDLTDLVQKLNNPPPSQAQKRKAR